MYIISVISDGLRILEFENLCEYFFSGFRILSMVLEYSRFSQAQFGDSGP